MSDRTLFFDSIYSELDNTVKKGWAALKFYVNLKKQSVLSRSIIPETQPLYGPQEIDSVALSLYPTDAPQNLIPVKVTGDGNCFFRTMSLLLFGNENFHVELRIRATLELVSNFHIYMKADTWTKMSSQPVTMQYLFETSISPECYVNENYTKSLQNEIMKSARKGEYASIIHIFALVNSLQCSVNSIFPEVNNPTINRSTHNQIISSVSLTLTISFNVMWTHCTNQNKLGWTPNHFVACIDRNIYQNKSGSPSPSKKAKKDDDHDLESDSEPKGDTTASDEGTFGTGKESTSGQTYSSQSRQEDRWKTPDVGNKPFQPRNKKFPGTFMGGKKRSFQGTWFDRWEWLHYDDVLDAAFCFICMKAYNEGTISGSLFEKTFISTGFKNWKKATTKFNDHETSKCHKEAYERSFELPKCAKDIGESVSSQIQREKEQNRENFLKIVSAIKYLARQGLAMRGHYDDRDSNFMQLLFFAAERDRDLRDWLNRKTDKFTSPVIQNELIKIMGNQVLREILEPIKDAPFFSLMADETTDVSNKEQLVICLRWVSKNFEPKENYVGLYEIENIRAETIFNSLADILKRFGLQISQLRGQCYDMGASMAGSKTGVSKRVSDIEPRAIYTHCYGHALNLACSDSIRSCKMLRNALDVTKEITKLIKESPRREAIFKKLKDAQDLTKASPGIRILCPTRWTVKADAFDSILQNYSVLQDVWEESLEYVKDLDMRGRINGVLAYMNKFEFIFSIFLAEMLFRHCDNLSKALQKEKTSAAVGQSMAKSTVTTLKGLQNDAKFTEIYEQVKKLAVKYNVDEPSLPRKRKAPKKLDLPSEPQSFQTVEEMYKSVYSEACELIMNGITSRFDQPGYKIYAHLEQLLLLAAGGRDFMSELTFVTDFYKSDINAKDLKTQLETLSANFPKDKIPSIETIANFIQTTGVSLYTEVAIILHLILVMPATNANSERSFSVLRRVKTYLRATMSQNRLNNLLLLSIHKELTDTLDTKDVAREFTANSEHRFSMFGRWK